MEATILRLMRVQQRLKESILKIVLRTVVGDSVGVRIWLRTAPTGSVWGRGEPIWAGGRLILLGCPLNPKPSNPKP